eukprot:COSAG02_NODE_1220_length_13807_cov_6.303254_10_plen_98_part_00
MCRFDAHSMHWNGAFASMLFLNHWEFTRNITFANETVYPLVSGLVSWWSCFLQRDKSRDGRLVLEDWNVIDPDESGENQVRNGANFGFMPGPDHMKH